MRRLLVPLAVALVVVLGGCRVDVAVDISANADGSGTITVTAVADKAVVDQAPGLSRDIRFSDAVKAGWKLTPPVDLPDGGQRVVLTHGFTTPAQATALLRSINGPGGPLHDVAMARTADGQRITVRLTGRLQVEGGLETFADPAMLASIGAMPWADELAAAAVDPTAAVTITVRAKLPGSVQTTGKLADGVATWNVPIGGAATQLTTTATTTIKQPSDNRSWWRLLSNASLIAMVLWVLAASAVLVAVTVARRRREQRRLVLMANRVRDRL